MGVKTTQHSKWNVSKNLLINRNVLCVKNFKSLGLQFKAENFIIDYAKSWWLRRHFSESLWAGTTP